MRRAARFRPVVLAFPVALAARSVSAHRATLDSNAASKASHVSVIEGDVYLVTKAGDTKKGAGLIVQLVRRDDTLQVRLDAICAAFRAKDTVYTRIWEQFRAQLNGPAARVDRWPISADSSVRIRYAIAAAQSSMEAAIRAEVSQRTVASAPTGMSAHYRLSDISAGEYVVTAEWSIGETRYVWWSPVRLRDQQVLRLDLDNSNEAGGRVYCGTRAISR